MRSIARCGSASKPSCMPIRRRRRLSSTPSSIRRRVKSRSQTAMVDDLLPYYNRELNHIRRLAAEFSETHPKVAGRLRLSSDAIEDPHVARLIEAFAFLTARVRRKLDDDLPELTEALLNVLYPHYLAPVPSMAIAQLSCPSDLAGSYVAPAGLEIETEPLGGESCRFRTCYPAVLWPITV